MRRTPQYWRQQASKASAAAGRLADPKLRERMERVAVGYQQVADAYERSSPHLWLAPPPKEPSR